MAISDSMKPALKTLVEAEFQRVGYDPNAASKASRAAKGDGAVVSASGVIPRVDLNSVLDKNIVDELATTDGKNSWQVNDLVLSFVTLDRIERLQSKQLFKRVNGAVILSKLTLLLEILPRL